MLKKIQSLSLEQKIGQLFFIGLPGAEFDEKTRKLLEKISPGGVCFFARNIREAGQTRILLEETRKILPVEPFLSLDQEGGPVDRLRRIVEPMPAVNSLKTPLAVGNLAKITARILRILGFNLNFAPVVDVINADRAVFSNGLFSRTFGGNKEETGVFAGRYLQILQENGCLGCLKHFPGLGASEIDSHDQLPAVNLTKEEFYETDLDPYRELLKTNSVHLIMTAHAAFPGLDLQETAQNGKLLPSSLSFNVISTLLRRQFDYHELVLTDDLEMGAIIKNYGIGEACKRALRAGQDMLLICNDIQSITEGYKAVLQAVKTGEIEEQRISESLERIANCKNLLTPPLDFEPNRLAELSGQILELKETI